MVGFVKSMKDTEPLTGVKITALCPGAVLTPLFDAQKTKQYSIKQAYALTPDTCATHLLDLLQKKDYPCGSVLEVTLAGTRVIPEWNVPPFEGDIVGQPLTEEFMRNMIAPITEKLASERMGAQL
jgi:NAD(P)-dependent dehydrogenase (short-subunit alcohol dehydrogenase family)